MKTLKYICYRLLLLAALILCAELLHQKFVYPTILKKESWIQELTARKLSNSPKAIYFSASPNAAYPHDDTSTYSISQFASQAMSFPLSSLDTGAFHAGIFYKILTKLTPQQRPEILVVDLNIRSFGANWIHSNLENSLQRNFVYWNMNLSIVNHLFAATKWYDYVSPAEHIRAIEYEEKFRKLPLKKEHSSIKNWLMDYRQSTSYSELGESFIRFFAFKIDKENEMLQNYDKLTHWAKINHIPLVYVVLPENMQTMNELIGAELTQLIHQNATYLTSRYTQENCYVLDLHDKLQKEQFFESFPTEHYRSAGRKMIGSKIAEKINSIKHQ